MTMAIYRRVLANCFIIGLPIALVALASAKHNRKKVVCGMHEVRFLKRCFCDIGWEDSTSVDGKIGLNCTVPVNRIDNCDCRAADPRRLFLKNLSAYPFHNDYRCDSLCRSNSQIGVPYANPKEWKDNQDWLQIGFYRKELPQKKLDNHLNERLRELRDGFQRWHYLQGLDLGDVIEFGAGGYTQLRNIMENVQVSIKSVVLLDPLIHQYKELSRCTYGTGKFIVNDTTINHTFLTNSTGENFRVEELNGFAGGVKRFDTVIAMNIVVYALNAFALLENIYNVLKPGGLLIFHDRWFENSIVSSRCKTSDFYRLMVQLKRPVLQHFVKAFTREPFHSQNRTAGMLFRSSNWCRGKDDEVGYFVVGRKK